MCIPSENMDSRWIPDEPNKIPELFRCTKMEGGESLAIQMEQSNLTRLKSAHPTNQQFIEPGQSRSLLELSSVYDKCNV